jgi:hypothetical protein
MSNLQPEPIASSTAGHIPVVVHHAMHRAHAASVGPRPANVEALILQVQREFPLAGVRVTGRGRTVQRQAELMAQRRRASRNQFLHVYLSAPHITEMDHWVTANPNASAEETATAFAEIIERARARGAAVSNHLSDRARDVSIPIGGHTLQNEVRHRIQNLGGHVIDEHDAVGGPHWHVDY